MPLPPIEYLLDASHRSLEDLRLAARNRAANLSKNLRHELDTWVQQEVEAEVADWFLEHREELLSARSIDAKPHKVEFFDDVKKRA